jgi:hypothetical protein
MSSIITIKAYHVRKEKAAKIRKNNERPPKPSKFLNHPVSGSSAMDNNMLTVNSEEPKSVFSTTYQHKSGIYYTNFFSSLKQNPCRHFINGTLGAQIGQLLFQSFYFSLTKQWKQSSKLAASQIVRIVVSSVTLESQRNRNA